METVTGVRVKGNGKVLDETHSGFKSLPSRITMTPAGIFCFFLFSHCLGIEGKEM